MQGDSAWRQVEAAVLCIGATVKGCSEGLVPYLPGLLAFLHANVASPHTALARISAWSLGQFGKVLLGPGMVRASWVRGHYLLLRREPSAVLPALLRRHRFPVAAVTVLALARFAGPNQPYAVAVVVVVHGCRRPCSAANAVPTNAVA